MNKQNNREGFIRNAEPAEPGLPVGEIIDNDAVASEPPKDEWPITVRLLHRGARKGAETMHALTFREPTGGDINRYGNPCRVNQDGDVVILEKKMTMIMSALAGVLPPFIETMDPRDWNSCPYRLRGFFIPDPTAW